MNIEKTRFKSGHWQILLSFQRSPNCNKGKEFRFWWSVDKYADSEDLVKQILEIPKLQSLVIQEEYSRSCTRRICFFFILQDLHTSYVSILMLTRTRVKRVYFHVMFSKLRKFCLHSCT